MVERLKESCAEPGKMKRALRKLLNKYHDSFASILLPPVAGALILMSPVYPDMYRHSRYDDQVNKKTEMILTKNASDEEVMDLLVELAFSRSNAEDLLTKVDEMAKAGPLRGFHPEEPHKGLWLLMEHYEWNGDVFGGPLCRFTGIWLLSGHRGGSFSNSQARVADLYYAGKMKHLIEKKQIAEKDRRLSLCQKPESCECEKK